MRATLVVVLSVMLMAGLCGTVVAGNIDSPGLPSAGSGMYTLQNLYDYIVSGTALEAKTSFQEPSAAPGSTMRTTKEIGDAIATPFAQCASTTAANVESGKKFFSTVSGSWGLQTGTKAALLTYKARTVAECISAGGEVFTDPGGSGTLCKFQASSCPGGWSQEEHWQQYAQAEWGGDYCGYHKSTGPTTFSNVASYCYGRTGGYQGYGCDPSYWNEWASGAIWKGQLYGPYDCSGSGTISIGCR
ncbi:MAG: hypothetical protein NTZ78_05055 [Candidatus Aureabacteria bacterium]|nr:hypothetical protein [Candidatus Auribacterota bacterium]